MTDDNVENLKKNDKKPILQRFAEEAKQAKLKKMADELKKLYEAYNAAEETLEVSKQVLLQKRAEYQAIETTPIKVI